jgi:hypothetical protein
MHQEIDATILIEFAGERIEHTYVVCESIAAGKSGFWPIAFEMFRRYTSNENVKGRLQYAIMRRDIPRSVMFGLPGIALQSRLHDVQKVLSEMPLSSSERTWLREIESVIRSEKETFERFESDVDAHRGPNVEDDPLASERLWMLRRLVVHGELNTLRRSTSKEEMLSLLPDLQLCEIDRIKLEEQISRWE